jgi:hypothetical protein
MDANGAFDSYTVEVASLLLKKADGASVEALPVKPRIDFADLADLKEFLTAVTLANGSYVSGTLRLDYTNADIVVNVNGVPTRAKPVDSSGAALTTVDVDIQLDTRKPLVISSTRPALLELDFDLLASNTVNLTTNPIQVTVQPFIVASVDVEADSREARVRGVLTSVSAASGDFHLDLRPFRLASGRLGDVTVHTLSQTVFEIDGVSYEGAPGVGALAALATGSPLAVYGSLDLDTRQFTAARVHAGTSVAGSQFDVIEGTVVARSGNSLAVRGATLIRRNGSVVFEDSDATLIVGPATKVIRDGFLEPQPLNIGSISVGQRIHAFGTVTEAANGDATLDATAGRVRMHLTRLLGTVKSALPNVLTLELATIDGHDASTFDFTGTGAQPALDALAADYEVEVFNPDLNDFTPGSAVSVIGFAAPFGTGPPDFESRGLADFRDVPAVLSVGWGLAGTSAPFLSIDATTGLLLDHDNSRIDGRHFIVSGGRVIDVTALASSPRIVPDTAGSAVFAIGEPRRVEIYTTFADFIAKLNDKLLAKKAYSISTTGSFDEATNTLTARRVLIEMR